LIRADLSPQVHRAPVHAHGAGFMNISALIPPEAAPPVAETAFAMSALVQTGLAGTAVDQNLPRETINKMIDLMLEQYSEKGKNEEHID
jgi:hypothetical protein